MRDRLLQDIYDRPRDDQPRLVYADWLVDQGDPLGELIQLEHRGMDAQRVQELYASLQPRLLGDLHGHVLPTAFRLGFLEEAVDLGKGSLDSPCWRTVARLETGRAELVAKLACQALTSVALSGRSAFVRLLEQSEPLPLSRIWPLRLGAGEGLEPPLPRSAGALGRLTHLALAGPRMDMVLNPLGHLLELPLPLAVVRIESHRPPSPADLQRWAAHPTLERVEWRGSGWSRSGRPVHVATLPAIPSPERAAKATSAGEDPQMEQEGSTEGPWPWAAATSRGPSRMCNEDAFGADVSGVWTVVDGMGAQESGDPGAAAVTRALRAPGSHAERFAAAVEALQEESLGQGAAAARLLFEGQTALVAWVGNVRVYRLHAGQLVQLTRDHTLVDKMVERGRIEPWQAARHPHANILLAKVQANGCEHSELTVPVERGDRLLLVTDGLWRALDNLTMNALILASATLHDAVGTLVGEAGRCDGRDNATALLVSFE